MKRRFVLSGLVAAAVVAVTPAMAATAPNSAGVPAQMVITLLPAAGGKGPQSLEAGDLTAVQGKTPAHVVGLQRLAGDLADMQLFVFLDDSTRSAGLGTHLPELKTFLQSLPSTTQVAVGYMRNGTFILAQAFTADHQAAANSLRLPEAIPGENGSPYFALSDLVKHWPSKQATGRRAVLMLTDGVDRYYNSGDMDDPYVDTAVHDALQDGVMVYSIYLRGAGLYGRGDWVTDTAQSRLMQVSQATGGFAYFMGFGDPVTVTPFLKDFQNRLENQYKVTIGGLNGHGVQPVKLRPEAPGLKIDAPSRIYVQ